MLPLSLVLLLAQGPPPSTFSAPSGTSQLVIVTSDGWRATRAQLVRFERDATGTFVPIGAAVEVVLGRCLRAPIDLRSTRRTGGSGLAAPDHHCDASLRR